MSEITEQQAERLAAFIRSVRHDWDAPGVKSALARARRRADVWRLAIVAIRAAADPVNRTPAVIALDGRHWRTPTQTDATSGVGIDHLCAHCSQPQARCQSEPIQRLDPHTFQPATGPTWSPTDALGGDGRPNGAVRKQIRDALAEGRRKEAEREALHEKQQAATAQRENQPTTPTHDSDEEPH